MILFAAILGIIFIPFLILTVYVLYEVNNIGRYFVVDHLEIRELK
jgi:hypothetical protein